MTRTQKPILIFCCIFLLLSHTLPSFSDQDPNIGTVPQENDDIFFPDPSGVKVETWVKHLEIPWSLVFLPNGDALVSERSGKIKLIPKGHSTVESYLEIGETYQNCISLTLTKTIFKL